MFPAQVLDVTPLSAVLNSDHAVLSLNDKSKLNKSQDRIDAVPWQFTNALFGQTTTRQPGPTTRETGRR
jgi:hypothetical protein